MWDKSSDSAELEPETDSAQAVAIQSVARAMQILEIVAAAKEIGVRELVAKTGLTRSTVHRLLTSLQDLGYLAQATQRGKYRLSLKLYSLGCQADPVARIREAARPTMEGLAETTGETVNLGVLSGSQVVYIDRIESVHTLRTVVRVGARAPFHCSSIGKAIAAFLAPEALDTWLATLRLPSFTARTLTDPASLRQHLEHVREQGFATNLGEHDANILSVAAPIFDPAGHVQAAISISAPSLRITEDDCYRLAPLVVTAAQEFSRHLGW